VKLGLSRTLILSAALVAFPQIHSAAESVEEFYRGRQVDFVVSTAPGTPHDAWARLLAKYMGKHMPGNPTFVIKNMPGAAHIVGANYLYSKAPQDGSTIGAFSQAIPVSAALQNKPGLEVTDFTRFSWLGSSDNNYEVCVVRPDSKVKKGEDLLTTEIPVGGQGAGSQITIIPHFLSNVLGLRFKIVDGYQSPNEIFLAIERGEIDGTCQTYRGVLFARPNAFKNGTLRILFSVEEDRIPGENAPTAHELFVKNEEQRQVLRFYNQATTIGRPSVIPPNVPKDRVDALRKAYNDSFKDPEMLAEAEKQGLNASPTTAQELEAKYAKILGAPKEIRDKAAAFIGE
jgi:tripartite-type tricarboxylate transporter receptor subunit TctC